MEEYWEEYWEQEEYWEGRRQEVGRFWPSEGLIRKDQSASPRPDTVSAKPKSPQSRIDDRDHDDRIVHHLLQPASSSSFLAGHMHLPHVQPAALGKQACSPPFATSSVFQRASAPVPALSSRHGPATGTALGTATGIGRITASTPPPSSSSTMVPAAATQSAFMCFQPR
ncbi:uncharacterized protein TrAFT101_001121 [Trichoderma asperellum]|uniref:uncharacterized protein n=1 Tax=Trichoderma asperellum TaxID=101201 RepID=UPI0033178609|nr:hypothetical protein TrAFT101_001121 [Trichoderma asperellum]